FRTVGRSQRAPQFRSPLSTTGSFTVAVVVSSHPHVRSNVRLSPGGTSTMRRLWGVPGGVVANGAVVRAVAFEGGVVAGANPALGARTVTVRWSVNVPLTADAKARNSVVSLSGTFRYPSFGVTAPKGSITKVCTSRAVHVTRTVDPGSMIAGSTRR